jgi:hypothetical protein
VGAGVIAADPVCVRHFVLPDAKRLSARPAMRQMKIVTLQRNQGPQIQGDSNFLDFSAA